MQFVEHPVPMPITIRGRNCQAVKNVARTAGNAQRPSVLREMQQRASTVENPSARQTNGKALPVAVRPSRQQL